MTSEAGVPGPVYSIAAGVLAVFLLLSGLALWLPPFFGAMSVAGLKVVYLHIFTGLSLAVLLSGGFIRLRSQGMGTTGIIRTFFFLKIKQKLPSWLMNGIGIAFLLLLVSGLVMVPGHRVPSMFLSKALFIHGAGLLLLLPLLCFIPAFLYVTNLRKTAEEAPSEWNPALDAETFRVTAAADPAISDKAGFFLAGFGSILKHSGFKHFMENYLSSGSSGLLFADVHHGKQLSECTTPGACLYMIYRRYFTLRGWISGWMSNWSLSESDIPHLADVFYRYYTCPPVSDSRAMAANEALMAKYGRLLLAEAGILPAGYARPSGLDKRPDSESGSGESFRQSLRVLEQELHDAGHAAISLSVARPGADILFLPAVHDLSGQSDTLKGMAVMLTAAGCSWTFGRTFFDGMNYGTFYSAWPLARIRSRLLEEAERLGAGQIILGGCSGFSFPDDSDKIITANSWVRMAVEKGQLTFNPKNYASEKIGFAGFCDSGCHLDDHLKSLWIAERVFGQVVQIGWPGNAKRESGADISEIISTNRITVIVAPYHNTRQRLRHIVKQYGLNVVVAGLYEILSETVVLS